MSVIARPLRSSTTFDSPIGPLTLTAREGRITGLYMQEHRHAPELARSGEPGGEDFEEAISQLRAYFAGRLRKFELPLELEGTGFQRQVWGRLLEVPYGETVSYGELARSVGKPGASRAVGLANGRNPISIVVPCHRVIGAKGQLVGYGGGLERKVWLLQHEASHRWD